MKFQEVPGQFTVYVDNDIDEFYHLGYVCPMLAVVFYVYWMTHGRSMGGQIYTSIIYVGSQ